MARVSYVELETASPEVREIYETTLRGKPGSVQKILAHRPAMLKAFLAFYASVGRSLDRRLYEMVYIRVSMINGCRYCLQHHLSASKRVGVDSRGVGPPERGRLLRLHRPGAGCVEIR